MENNNCPKNHAGSLVEHSDLLDPGYFGYFKISLIWIFLCTIKTVPGWKTPSTLQLQDEKKKAV